MTCADMESCPVVPFCGCEPSLPPTDEPGALWLEISELEVGE